MSRVGKNPVSIPGGVTVEVAERVVTVRGTKGELTYTHSPLVDIAVEDGAVVVTRKQLHHPETAAQHGLTRTLVANMVQGVSEGFSKKLEINGVGYRVQGGGNKLTLSLGYSHPHEYSLPEGITAAVEQNTITISGIDKQLVGQVAANIRELRKPEPYKGKGIKYADERIVRKAGKTAGK